MPTKGRKGSFELTLPLDAAEIQGLDRPVQVAIVLERVTSRAEGGSVAVFDEKGDETDAVLREGKSAAATGDDSQSGQP